MVEESWVVMSLAQHLRRDHFMAKYNARLVYLGTLIIVVTYISLLPPHTVEQWVVIGCAILAPIIQAIHPVIGSWIVVLLIIGYDIVPNFRGNFVVFFPILTALGTLAYYLPIRKSIYAFIGVIVGTAINLFLHAAPITVFALAFCLSECVVCCFPYFFGLFTRRTSYHGAARVEQVKMSHQHKQLMFAQSLHDEISSELSLMALLSHQYMQDDTLSEEERERWTAFNGYCRHTVRNMRTIIEALSNTEHVEELPASFQSQYDDAIAEFTHTLTEQGFIPAVQSTGEMSRDVDAGLTAGICAFIRELGCNVVKYAQPHSQVDMVVNMYDGELTLLETNDVKQPAHYTESSHMGLKLHEESLRAYGATVHYALEDNTWTLFMRIPLTSTNQTKSNTKLTI